MADEPTISQEPTDDPERRRRFEAVLGASFPALGAGQWPDRQGLWARNRALAAELAEFFAEQDRFHRMVAPLRPESAEAGGSPTGHPGDPGSATAPPPAPTSVGPAETQVQPSAGPRNSHSM